MKKKRNEANPLWMVVNHTGFYACVVDTTAENVCDKIAYQKQDPQKSIRCKLRKKNTVLKINLCMRIDRMYLM